MIEYRHCTLESGSVFFLVSNTKETSTGWLPKHVYGVGIVGESYRHSDKEYMEWAYACPFQCLYSLLSAPLQLRGPHIPLDVYCEYRIGPTLPSMLRDAMTGLWERIREGKGHWVHGTTQQVVCDEHMVGLDHTSSM